MQENVDTPEVGDAGPADVTTPVVTPDEPKLDESKSNSSTAFIIALISVAVIILVAYLA